MALTELLLRLAIAFVTLLVLARLMGRKEISQMTFFNFISAISIGTIGASLAIDATLAIRNGIIALVAWSIFTIVLGFLDIKSIQARKVINGEPLIVVREGKIMEGALRKARLDTDSLQALLRKKNVFSLADVEFAIFETDRSLSVMKKPDKQPVTKSDENVQQFGTKMSPIPFSVIADGTILDENLKKLNLNKQWLHEQLIAAGVKSVSDVFYAEVQQDGTLYIDKRNEMLH